MRAKGIGIKSYRLLVFLYKRKRLGFGFVRFKEIVEEMKTSRQSVSNMLKRLVELGYIERVCFGVYTISKKGEEIVKKAMG